MRNKERGPISEFFRQSKSVIIIMLVLLTLALALWTGYRYVIDNYTVTRIYVDGNIQYTHDEIVGFVMQGPYGDNSLLLSRRYRDRSITDIPFIEKMDVTILDNNTIRISVYEKAVAGYVEYLGNYLYFDKDGIIVESSNEKMTGIPEVIGLTFDYAIMHEKLPVRDMTLFTVILNIRHLLEQYEVPADRISFSSQNHITLHYEKIKVALGNEGHIDEKIMELPKILPSLAGKSGTLRMENYDAYSLETIFEPD
jgi:cell division protein FtsQ